MDTVVGVLKRLELVIFDEIPGLRATQYRGWCIISPIFLQEINIVQIYQKN